MEVSGSFPYNLGERLSNDFYSTILLSNLWFKSIRLKLHSCALLRRYRPAMSVDSAAAFRERYCDNVIQLGAHQARFELAGWHTFADLVFSTTFTPQNGDEGSFVRDIIVKGLGDADHVDKIKLRRLFFEGYT